MHIGPRVLNLVNEIMPVEFKLISKYDYPQLFVNNQNASLIQNIDEIEKKLNIGISVEPKESTLKNEIPWNFIESGAFIVIKIKNSLRGKTVDLYNGEKFILSAAVGKKGSIKIKKKSDVGRETMSAVASNNLKIVM